MTASFSLPQLAQSIHSRHDDFFEDTFTSQQLREIESLVNADAQVSIDMWWGRYLTFFVNTHRQKYLSKIAHPLISVLFSSHQSATSDDWGDTFTSQDLKDIDKLETAVDVETLNRTLSDFLDSSFCSQVMREIEAMEQSHQVSGPAFQWEKYTKTCTMYIQNHRCAPCIYRTTLCT